MVLWRIVSSHYYRELLTISGKYRREGIYILYTTMRVPLES